MMALVWPVGTRRASFLPAASAILALSLLILDLSVKGNATGALYPILVLSAAWAPVSREIVSQAVLSTLLAVLGYLYGSTTVAPDVMLTGRALMVLAVWLTAPLAFLVRDVWTRQSRRVAELEAVVARERAITEALLPMCAWCKRVRNEKASWERIEAWLRDETGANVTHGICPDCARRAYPDLWQAARPHEPAARSV